MNSYSKYEGGMAKQMRESLYNKLSQVINSKHINKQVEAEETAELEDILLKFKKSIDDASHYI